jgi:LL-H family phage holin
MNEQIILALIPYAVPSAIGLIVYIYHQVFQRLPQKQRDALEQLATPVVQMVEQSYGSQSPLQKKEEAMAAIKLGFKAFGLPAPNDELISAFIESAVFEMNRLRSNTNTQPLPQIQVRRNK